MLKLKHLNGEINQTEYFGNACTFSFHEWIKCGLEFLSISALWIFPSKLPGVWIHKILLNVLLNINSECTYVCLCVSVFVWVRACLSPQPSEASPHSIGSAVSRRPKVWTGSTRGCPRDVTPSTVWACRWAAWTWESPMGPTATAIYSDGHTLTHAQTHTCSYNCDMVPYL